MQGCVSGRRTRLGRKPLRRKMHPADRSKSLLSEYRLVHRHLCWPYELSYSLHWGVEALVLWRHCYILQLVVTLLYHESRCGGWMEILPYGRSWHDLPCIEHHSCSSGSLRHGSENWILPPAITLQARCVCVDYSWILRDGFECLLIKI